MTVELLHFTPLKVCAKAIRKSHNTKIIDVRKRCPKCGSEDIKQVGFSSLKKCMLCNNLWDIFDENIISEKDRKLIHKVGRKYKHESVLEHLVYSFDIDGISRACLQELVRHRMASMTVKSTRYTLKELKREKQFHIFDIDYDRASKYLVWTDIKDIDIVSFFMLEDLRSSVVENISNDYTKYNLPESFKTSLVWTINARSLLNFLKLRYSKEALWEIRELALKVYKSIPFSHRYLFEDCIKDEIC